MKIRSFNQDLFLMPAIIGKPDGTVTTVPHGSGDSRKIAWLYSAIDTYNGVGGAFRPCLHQKAQVTRSAPSADMFISPTDPVRFTANTVNWAIADAYDLFESTAANRPASEFITPQEWAGFSSDAAEAMKPSLTSNNSLVNFLIELKDFKHLGAKLLTSFKAITSKLTQTAYGAPSTGYKPGKELLEALWASFGQRPWNGPRPKGKVASDAWLQWRLAWLPFVSDLQKLTSGIQSFTRDVRQFRQRAGKQQQRYWGKDLPTPYDGETIAVGSYVPPELRHINNLDIVWRWWLEETWLGDARFNATMRYRYSLTPEMWKAAGDLDGFLDRLGVNGNPAILWNALPFTFVIDWFVNIGNYLNKLRVDNVRPTTEITDFCSSAKIRRKVTLKLRGDVLETMASPAQVGAVPTFVALESLSTFYKRRAEMPSLTLVSGSGLNGTRLITAAALINSRIH